MDSYIVLSFSEKMAVKLKTKGSLSAEGTYWKKFVTKLLLKYTIIFPFTFRFFWWPQHHCTRKTKEVPHSLDWKFIDNFPPVSHDENRRYYIFLNEVSHFVQMLLGFIVIVGFFT